MAGALFWAGIWTAAEGMGLPITAGQTDIGTSIIYVFVFAALLFGTSGTTSERRRVASRAHSIPSMRARLR